MALANPFLQSLLDVVNDPTTDDGNIMQRLKGLDLQKGVVALLASAVASLVVIAGGTVPVAALVALARSVSNETDSTHSPIPAGAKSIALIFSSDFAGTIGGVAIDPAKCPSYTENAGQGYKLAALAFTVTAGSMVKIVLTPP